MSKTLECHVHLWGEEVGVLASIKGKMYFQYEDSFLKKGLDISPLHLPLSPKVYDTTTLTYFEGLAGVFADALPDSWGNKIIENFFTQQEHLSPYDISPVQKLLYMGKRSMGALEFAPSTQTKSSDTQQMLDIASLVEDSRKVLKGDMSTLLPELFRVSSDSLGGAKAKVTVGMNTQTKEIMTANTTLEKGFEHWLIKFDGTDEQARPTEALLAEKVYLDMAKRCGIDSVESQIIHDRNLSHLAVKRFDRVGDEKPLHVHTLAGMAHINFRDKESMSYDTFFRTILAVTHDYSVLEEGFRRMVFNVLAGNQDDHAKNHSFVMNKKGIWRLSPAYDISPTFGYGHQMSINFKDKGVNEEDLLIMAERFDIKNARKIIAHQKEVISHFPKYAKDIGISQKKCDEIAKHLKVH